MKRVVVLLAEGFEEIEAVTPVDVLRRGGIEVVVAGVDADVVTGSHNLTFDTDTVIDEIDFAEFDGVILPGGLPGAVNLSKSQGVNSILEQARGEDKLIAAICASPALVLSPLGLLDNKKTTGYPGVEFKFFERISYLEEKVIQDGSVITGMGPGAAFDFALKILEYLADSTTADKVAAAMLFRK